MTEAIPIDRVVEEDLRYGEENVVKETFEEKFVREYHPEPENLNENSRVLRFEIPGIPAKIFRPWSVVLELPVQVVMADGTSYRDSDNPNRTTPTDHARFKNMAGLYIIKKVEVKPKSGADVEIQQPELTGLRELLRFFFQQSEEEKNNKSLLYTHFISWPLAQARDDTLCGKQTVYENMPSEVDALEIEKLTYNGHHTLRIKLPGGFFENASYIPSSLSFEVTITLAGNAEMLIQRSAATNGLGAISGTANTANAKYVIKHTDVRLVVTYKTLPDGKDEDGRQVDVNRRAAFEQAMFGGDPIKFNLFDTFYVTASVEIAQRYNANGTELTRILRLENRFDKHTIFGFVKRENVTSVGSPINVSLMPFQPFSIARVQITVDGVPLFKNGGIAWQNTQAKKNELWESINDSMGDPDNTERRIHSPVGDPLHLEKGRWFCYLNMEPDRDSNIQNVSNRLIGVVTVTIHFIAGADATGAHVPISMIFAQPQHRTLTLQDAITNEWGVVEETIPPLDILTHVNTGRKFT